MRVPYGKHERHETLRCCFFLYISSTSGISRHPKMFANRPPNGSIGMYSSFIIFSANRKYQFDFYSTVHNFCQSGPKNFNDVPFQMSHKQAYSMKNSRLPFGITQLIHKTIIDSHFWSKSASRHNESNSTQILVLVQQALLCPTVSKKTPYFRTKQNTNCHSSDHESLLIA